MGSWKEQVLIVKSNNWQHPIWSLQTTMPSIYFLETSVMALSAFENMISNNVSKAMVKAIENAIINGNGKWSTYRHFKWMQLLGVKLDVKDFDYATLGKSRRRTTC